MSKLRKIEEVYERDDYLKANINRYYLNEIIIKNQNSLLRDHNSKIKKIENTLLTFQNIIITLMIFIFIFTFIFIIVFHNNK